MFDLGTSAVGAPSVKQAHGEAASRDEWNKLVKEGRLGYADIVDGLSEMLASGVDMRPVIKTLTDPEAVRASGMLPFRLYRAWKELEALPNGGFRMRRQVGKVESALVDAMGLACDNAGHLEGLTAVLVNTSRSMGAPVSAENPSSCGEVAAVLVALLKRICDEAAVWAFEAKARYLLFCGCNVVKDAGSLPFTGGEANVAAGFELLRSSAFDVARVVVISDNLAEGDSGRIDAASPNLQVVREQLDAYCDKVGHEVWCHVIDLKGSDYQQLVEQKINVMAGWSEEMVRAMVLVEAGDGGAA